MTKPFAQIVLKKPERQAFSRLGHPWFYRSHIKEVKGDIQPGALAQIVQSNGAPVGVGYFNPNSEISVRLLSHRSETIDKEFFKNKITAAVDQRKRFVRESNAMRLISSEADGLPGLIVDKYDEVLVVQFLTLGMEQLRGTVLEALEAVVPSRGVYERSDSSSRKIEGLPEKTGWIRQDCAAETTVLERDIRFQIRFDQGHKTGFYLDQRENRLLMRDMGLQGEVLDAFCYSGGFGLHLAKAGCRVTGIDIQKEAIEQAQANRALNGISEESAPVPSFMN